MPQFSYDQPQDAIQAWLEKVKPVEAEHLPYHQVTGRVLASDLKTDRDSPACDVSAMDGISVHHNSMKQELTVSGESSAGHQPPQPSTSEASRCFTGATIPLNHDTIIRREDLKFHKGKDSETVEITCPLDQIRKGQNIRFQGENLKSGDTIVSSGTLITPTVMGCIASIGAARLPVVRKVSVNILTTGNELLDIQSSPNPWQIRDSNGPALYAYFQNQTQLNVSSPLTIKDDLAKTRSAIEETLESTDLMILTGGVSMGDHDYVPQALLQAGCQIVFHKLPIRPGKPVLGAVGPQGQVILALPGNPVSALVGARIFAQAAIRKLCDQLPLTAQAQVHLTESPRKTIPFWHYIPVQLHEDGLASIVPSQGSGDMMAAARSDGLVCIPPHDSTTGPFPYYGWTP